MGQLRQLRPVRVGVHYQPETPWAREPRKQAIMTLKGPRPMRPSTASRWLERIFCVVLGAMLEVVVLAWVIG